MSVLMVPVGRRPGLRPVIIPVVVGGSAILLGCIGASLPPSALLAAAAVIALVALTYAHPPAAAYLLLAATPLLAGFPRDTILPVLRPHEALLLVVGTGVALRALAQLWSGHRLPLRFGRLDAAILALAVTSSLLPCLWLAARGLTPSQDDLYYAATLWKFYAIFVLVRISIRSERQVARCLWICLGVGAVVAVVAILQSVFAGVADALYAFYPEEEGAGSGPPYGRGSATLGSSIAVGDVMAFDLAVCLGWAMSRARHRRALLALAMLFALGGLGSGQFSGVLAVLIAVVAVAFLTRQMRRLLLASVPAAVGGVLVLWPVVQARLADVDSATGVPQSWWVRQENLRLYVWPQLFDAWNWLFGVRPAAVVQVDTPWGAQVFIESGHTWLLWIGGIPFLLAFLYWTWSTLPVVASVARLGSGAFAVAAIGSFAAVIVVFVLMTFDPHLTMRGTADLLFALLGLTAVGVGARRRPSGSAA